MPVAVGVAFKRVARSFYFSTGDLEVREGNRVVVEASTGLSLGHVKIGPHEVLPEDLEASLRPIVRVATDADLDRERQNEERADKAMGTCRRFVADHQLPMKLVSAEYTFDGSQITYYFTAEGRVDFRALVKDVSRAIRCKVMFYQIGERDHAKSLGGVGVCGLTLCCSTFLTEFKSISMKMAKDQNLFLNPVKFSGVCGKLMCCLEYEHEVYKEGRAKLPSIGAPVETPKGQGRCADLNIPREVIGVHLDESDALVWFPAADCTWEVRITTACGSSCGGKVGHCGVARKLFRRDDEEDSAAE